MELILSVAWVSVVQFLWIFLISVLWFLFHKTISNSKFCFITVYIATSLGVITSGIWGVLFLRWYYGLN